MNVTDGRARYADIPGMQRAAENIDLTLAVRGSGNIAGLYIAHSV